MVQPEGGVCVGGCAVGVLEGGFDGGEVAVVAWGVGAEVGFEMAVVLVRWGGVEGAVGDSEAFRLQLREESWFERKNVVTVIPS